MKRARGRLDAPDDLEEAPCAAGFLERLVTFAAVRRLATLPAHHDDPFDRILVAQALEEAVPLVGGVPRIARYPVQVIW